MRLESMCKQRAMHRSHWRLLMPMYQRISGTTVSHQGKLIGSVFYGDVTINIDLIFKSQIDFCANNPCDDGYRCVDHGDEYSCVCPGSGDHNVPCDEIPRTVSGDSYSLIHY